MINFFRKKRKKLADDNKALKYARYAIGEIVLVVIWILIALQINTWNQGRLALIEEKGILKNIHREFIQNKIALKESILSIDRSYANTRSIVELVGLNRNEINKHNPDSLLFLALESGSFRPSENTISDLFQSGRLQMLHNDPLKELIYLWSISMKSYNVSSQRKENKIDNELVGYLSKKYSMKDIDMYGELK